jgi:hypothetical protein
MEYRLLPPFTAVGARSVKPQDNELPTLWTLSDLELVVRCCGKALLDERHLA